MDVGLTMLQCSGRSPSSSRPLFLVALHQLAARLLITEGSAPALIRRIATSSDDGSAVQHPVSRSPTVKKGGKGDAAVSIPADEGGGLIPNFPLAGVMRDCTRPSQTVSGLAYLASVASQTDGKAVGCCSAGDVLPEQINSRPGNASVKVERPPAKASRKHKSSTKLYPSPHDAIEKVRVLNAGGISPSDLATLLQTRAFLGCSQENLAAVLKLLEPVAGGNACKIVVKNPGMLKSPIEDLEAKLTLFKSFGISNKVLARVGTFPHYLFTGKVEDLRLRLGFLEEIGLCGEDRNRILHKYPLLLRLSVESSLRPTLEFLKSNAKLDDKKLLQCLCCRPEILGMSIENNLMPKITLFEKLGFTTPECYKMLMHACTVSCHQIESSQLLLKHLGFTDDEVHKISVMQPDILGKASESIKAKVHCLIDIYERDFREIVRLPSALSYSLERRVMPRLQVLREKNMDKNYSLGSILPIKLSSFRKRFDIPDSVALT